MKSSKRSAITSIVLNSDEYQPLETNAHLANFDGLDFANFEDDIIS